MHFMSDYSLLWKLCEMGMQISHSICTEAQENRIIWSEEGSEREDTGEVVRGEGSRDP